MKLQAVVKRLLVSATLLCAATTGVAENGAPVGPRPGDDGWYEYRFGIPAGTSIGALSDEPEPLDFNIVDDPDFSEAGVASVIEYHGVYPMESTRLLDAITAYGDYPRISRRVTESEVWEPEGPAPYRPIGEVSARQETLMQTSFKFLFFGREYDYVLSSMTEQIGEDAHLVRSRMRRSLDGGLAAIHYSWYLKPLTSGDGEPETYLRYFARVDFAEEPSGLRLALDLFARSDVERLLESIYRYARTGR